MVDSAETARDQESSRHRSGYVAIVGRPNVGKSTLLNRMVGQKIAIVTPKPQTTRGRIVGIKTLPHAQIIFVDTPGLHDSPSLPNQRMRRSAEAALASTDVVLWMVDATVPLGDPEQRLAARLRQLAKPLCAAVNKIDLKQPAELIPLLAGIGELLPDRDVVPVSALTGAGFEELLHQLIALLPPGPRYFEEDVITDQTERTLAQEVVREKVLLLTRQEVPYSVAVTVDSFEEKDQLAVIEATIHVERPSQKAIVIGARGALIKRIGTEARLELEDILGRRVFLRLFVRVQEKWTSDPARLQEFGF